MTYHPEGRQPCPTCSHLHFYGHDTYGTCRVCDCPQKPSWKESPVAEAQRVTKVVLQTMFSVSSDETLNPLGGRWADADGNPVPPRFPDDFSDLRGERGTSTPPKTTEPRKVAQPPETPRR